MYSYSDVEITIAIEIWCLDPTTLSTEDKVARAFSALALIFGGLFVLMGTLKEM